MSDSRILEWRGPSCRISGGKPSEKMLFTNNVDFLYDSLNEMDQQTFQFTFRDFESWNKYMESAVKGIREFAMKQDPLTIDDCKKKLKFFYIIHQIWTIFLLGMIYFVLSRAWEIFM